MERSEEGCHLCESHSVIVQTERIASVALAIVLSTRLYICMRWQVDHTLPPPNNACKIAPFRNWSVVRSEPIVWRGVDKRMHSIVAQSTASSLDQ